jgi:hypothetical protein
MVTSAVNGELVVNVQPTKVTGQKAIVPLQIENNWTHRVESARAAVFILDDQGKMVGRSTRWVIGADNESKGLPSGGTNLFYFVVPLEKSVSHTNITAKVTFTRVVLEGGKLADANKEVKIQLPPK